MRGLITDGAFGDLIGVFPLVTGSAAATLYDVDFGSPPHTVGLPPATGDDPPPRDTVSSVNLGAPIVVSSAGGLIDQPLEFDSFDGQGDQIQLDLFDLPPSTFYSLECDVLVIAVEPFGELAILFDTPQIAQALVARFMGNEQRAVRVFQASDQCAADKPGAAKQQYAVATHDLRSSRLW